MDEPMKDYPDKMTLFAASLFEQRLRDQTKKERQLSLLTNCSYHTYRLSGMP